MLVIKSTYNEFKYKYLVIKSYYKFTSLKLFLFLSIRIFLLPMKSWCDKLPKNGEVVEIGCGHGSISKYIALKHKNIKIIGIDPDTERVDIARKSSVDIDNIRFENTFFGKIVLKNIDSVFINGVLYLIPDKELRKLLIEIRISLKDCGIFVLSDIPKYEAFNLKNWAHILRENFFKRIGFTYGEGIYLRTSSEWKALLESAGFKEIEYFNADVFMHSTFNLTCKKMEDTQCNSPISNSC
jgi:SAM-dependent methyltransferase